MTWFKIDDSFYDHPKVFDAPDCAVALWVRAGTWAARSGTDGFVPAGLANRMCDDPARAVKELVQRGLWSEVSGGYRFHDWSDYQPSAASVKELRAKRAEAGKRGGHARAANQTSSKSQALASPVASDLLKQSSTPTRPVGTGGKGEYLGEQTVTRAKVEEPPLRCPQHIEAPTSGPCGPCGDARRVRERWERGESDRRRTQQQCRQHRGQPAHSCGLCRAELLAP